MFTNSFRSRSFGLLSVLVACAICVASTRVDASINLEFDDLGGAGGTIFYDGEGGALVGTDILFDSVAGHGTPLNDGVSLSIVNGDLDFTTGLNTSEPGTSWEFGSGGSFVLTGTVFDGLTQVATGTLLSGSFTGTPIVVGGGTFVSFVGFGVDTKNQDLLDYYGITDEEFVFANTEISMDATIGANQSIDANVVNADLNNTSVIPEPVSAIVWAGGACIVGLCSFRMRRKYFTE